MNAWTFARLGQGVHLRPEGFGGIAYVHERDRFFALDRPHFELLSTLKHTIWSPLGLAQRLGQPAVVAVHCLAGLGLVELDPPAELQAYSGPGFVGSFLEIPSVRDPLVVNVFTTARCPLSCKYCHADDLMGEARRAQEPQLRPAKAAVTARRQPAMVLVLTGGDPITSPERCLDVMKRLPTPTPLVLDTSGVGDIEPLMDQLIERSVHVRVSLDAVSEKNDLARPPNPQYARGSHASRRGAVATINKLLGAGLSVTVQSVISKLNDTRTEWEGLYTVLRDTLKVRNWVIHLAVAGGAARKRESRKPGSILPRKNVTEDLRRFLEEVSKEGVISVRCTDSHARPNSVFLVGTDGGLYTEGYAHFGKVRLEDGETGRARSGSDRWTYIDAAGHAARYLNWARWRYPKESLGEVCLATGLTVWPGGKE